LENGSTCTNFKPTKDDKELGTNGQSQRWNPRSISNYFAFAFMEEPDTL